MGIRPWRECCGQLTPGQLGVGMSTYYGGRSEVHIRREVAPGPLLRLPLDVSHGLGADGLLALHDCSMHLASRCDRGDPGPSSMP